MKALRGRPAAELATAAIIVLGGAATFAIDLPGHLSYDSVIQLLEGRTGVYGTWHPPVMSWLLGVTDALVPGTALFVLLDIAVVFGALLSLLRLGSGATWTAAAIAVFCVLSPQFLLYQGFVWKDVLFANAAIAGFVCLAHAAHCWSAPRERFTLIVLASSFFILAGLARQNGVLVGVVGAAALGCIAATNAEGLRRWRGAAVYGCCALLIAAILGTCANMLLDSRSDADPDEWGPIEQMKLLQNYDIIGMVAARPGLELSQLEDTEPALAAAIRKDGVRLYTPQRNDTLEASVPLQKALADSEPGELRDQWTALIVHHPWLYLTVRARAFAWVAFTPEIGRCVPFMVGVDGPADEMKRLGLKPRMDARDRALSNYGSLFEGTPIFSHATFMLVAAAALFLLLRRRSPEDIAIAFMLIGAFAFTLSFFVISIACDYRYLYFLDLSALFAAFYVALNPSLISVYWRKS